MIGLLSIIQFISSSISLKIGVDVSLINLIYIPFISIFSLIFYKISKELNTKRACFACFNCSVLLIFFSFFIFTLENSKSEHQESKFIDVELERISPSDSPLIVGNAVQDFKSNFHSQCGFLCNIYSNLGLRQPFYLVDAHISPDLWRVGGIASETGYQKSDGLRPIIAEISDGTLYLFRNGDFYFWRHTKVGTSHNFQIDIDLDNVNLKKNSRKAVIRYNSSFIEDKFEEKGADFFRGKFEFYENICDEAGAVIPNAKLDKKLLFATRCKYSTRFTLPDGQKFFESTHGDDFIELGAGNSMVIPLTGKDIITLSPGADVIVISTSSYMNGDHKTINGFSVDDGDVLDIRHTIEFKSFEPDNITAIKNHIKLQQTSLGIEVWVDPDAFYTEHSLKHVATLVGLQLKDTDLLLRNGSIAFF